MTIMPVAIVTAYTHSPLYEVNHITLSLAEILDYTTTGKQTCYTTNQVTCIGRNYIMVELNLILGEIIILDKAYTTVRLTVCSQ